MSESHENFYFSDNSFNLLVSADVYMYMYKQFGVTFKTNIDERISVQQVWLKILCKLYI